ncbi:MAG: immunity 26/phosphotriesterase HocA family protein [Bacteroidia bacterium]
MSIEHKRQRFTPGAIVRIPFGDGYHTYGRLLVSPFIEVYDLETNEELSDLEAIVARPVLFTINVHKSAITRSDWRIIGKLPYDEKNAVLPLQFWQDSSDPSKCKLKDRFDNFYPAKIEDCRGLERIACWEAHHVEERLRDHYSGKMDGIASRLRVQEVED